MPWAFRPVAPQFLIDAQIPDEAGCERGLGLVEPQLVVRESTGPAPA